MASIMQQLDAVVDQKLDARIEQEQNEEYTRTEKAAEMIVQLQDDFEDENEENLHNEQEKMESEENDNQETEKLLKNVEEQIDAMSWVEKQSQEA